MTEIKSDKTIIVSMCLAGIKCNYKGESSPCQRVIDLIKNKKAVPLCPEQLGGLNTPRPAAEQVEDRVITKDGRDFTEEFRLGAEKVLDFARTIGVDTVILKARSPSCGKGRVYDGTFSKKTIEGNGVTADLLIKNGIRVFTEEEI
jgi:uncharacterized protein YbbK (DUF523 family)